MNRGVFVSLLAVVLAAGARVTVTPAAPHMATTYSATAGLTPDAVQPKGTKPGNTKQGDTSCSEFADLSGDTNSVSPETTDLVRQFLHGALNQTNPAPISLKGIHIIVATVADPLHTHLNLQFDRTIDAIQQAAQDQGYTYDSSWLPWKAQEAEYSGLADQQNEDKEISGRERCPGLILFRQTSHGSSTDSYNDGLFVFLVGEMPTTGINRIQWDNAIRWIDEHASKEDSHQVLRVLGPTYSGSVSSVARALITPPKLNSNFSNTLLYSGTVSGCSSIQWLKDRLKNTAGVHIANFIQNDAIQGDRYYKYLQDRGHSLSEVAVLSEDETAYGGLPDVKAGAIPTTGTALTAKPDMTKAATAPAGTALAATPRTCEPSYEPDNAPLHLYYPRDISALRSAYQEQSIFATANGDKSNAPHVVLQPQATMSTHHDTDTVATFSGPNSALAQEAQMYGIVDSLKAHGIRFVILRSTSSLDFLFLTRFLHRAYPGAFIVTMGADMLFGREIDSTEFRGVEALTTFPLLPRGQDWTTGPSGLPRHAHRVFGNDLMEGTYLATRFLITDSYPSKPSANIDLLKADIPDYRAPFWERSSSDLVAPSTWLSVVGRDGYWPVAVLTEPLSTSASPASTVEAVTLPSAPDADPNHRLWKFTLSPSWKLCCGLAGLAVCLHFYACLFGWRRENQSMFIQFAPLPEKRQLILIGIGWASIGSLVILMLRCSDRIGSSLEKSSSVWIPVLYIAAWSACLGVVLDVIWRVFCEPDSAQVRARLVDLRGVRAYFFIAFPFVLVAGVYRMGSRIFDYPGANPGPANYGVQTAFRAVHLTNGVSPIVPLLLLLSGFYWWSWHTLSGLALFGEGRPILPRKSKLANALARITDDMAAKIESSATPLPSLAQGWIFYILPLMVLALPILILWHKGLESFDPVFHSLENHAFNKTLHVLLALAVYLLIFECSQLLSTWFSLKRLLLALNRTPLRRTFSALQGLSMHSLWSMSGTSSRSRYTVFSHQLESLFHLRNVLAAVAHGDCGSTEVRASIDIACNRGMTFVEGRSSAADLAMINDPEIRGVREEFRQCTEILLNDLILPEWVKETCSMDLVEKGEKSSSTPVLPLSENEPVRHAEEFVSLIYVGYLQNMLARMRTMVLSVIGVLAAFAFSLAFYPFIPRPTITVTLLMLVGALGSAVAAVYAGLDRDATLSQITNTEPGKLGLGFWVRYGSFIGVPILGLLVSQFPAITDFVTSWLEPSLNAVK